MSKVFEHYNELEQLHGSQDPEPTKKDMPGFEGTWKALDELTGPEDDIDTIDVEPTDAELEEIEEVDLDFDDAFWEDC